MSFLLNLAHKRAFIDLAYTLGRWVTPVVSWTHGTIAQLGLSKTRQLIQEHAGIHFLDTLCLNSVNVCNAKCVFCVYPQVAKQPGRRLAIMPWEVLRKVASEAREMGIRTVDLTPVVGDPLVDPEIDQKVAYLTKDCGFNPVMFTTNGILLGRNEMYRRLLDAGLTHIFFSIPGCNREEYKQTYGVDSYYAVRDGIQKLLNLNRERGGPLQIQFRFRNPAPPSFTLDSEDFKKIIQPFVGPNVSFNFTRDYDNWGGAVGPEHMVGQMRLRTPSHFDAPCCGLLAGRILADGNLRLCGCRMKVNEADDLVVGNVLTEKLGDIMRSERVRRILMDFSAQNRPETCKNCTLYTPMTPSWLRQRIQQSQQPPK